MKFTQRGVDALRPGPKRRIIYEDNSHGLGSLGLRISPAGGKSWVYSYSFDGRVRHMTLGRYPRMSVAKAHAAFGEATRLREQGVDPGSKIVAARADARAAPTVAELVALYLELYARPRKKSAARDEAILQRELIPILGHKKAQDVNRQELVAVLDRIVARGSPIAANRALAVIRKMFNWAEARGSVPASPCRRIPRPSAENQRDRVLSEAELRSVLDRLPGAPMDVCSKLAFLFQLLTAQRCGEVVGAVWSEIELDTGWWVIPAARAKNGRLHRVPLSPQALAVLGHASALSNGGQFVFRSFRGRSSEDRDSPMAPTAMSRAVRRSVPHLGVEAFTPHDLRRTAATEMIRMRVPQVVVGKLLNHVERKVIAVYDRYTYDDEKAAALSDWGTRLASLGCVTCVGALTADIITRTDRRQARQQLADRTP